MLYRKYGMFEHLRIHQIILVSGPGRSGTRICAKMIANDTGLPYIDEVEVPGLFIIGQEISSVVNLIAGRGPFILHCPTLSRYLHELPGNPFTIFMWRDLQEIHRSQQRVHVKRKSLEREYNKYGFSRFYKSILPRTPEDISSIKQRYWTIKQKPVLYNYLEIQYNSLAEHQLWLDPAQRQRFKWNQTELSNIQHET